VPPELLHEIYSELALQQILEIEWRLEAQNPDRAEVFRQELAELVSQLLIFPESAPVVGERKQVRKRLFKRFNYGLLYVIHGEHLLITLIYPLGRESPFWDDYFQ
jgi:plasmid stabilization system protein ParE